MCLSVPVISERCLAIPMRISKVVLFAKSIRVSFYTTKLDDYLLFGTDEGFVHICDIKEGFIAKYRIDLSELSLPNDGRDDDELEITG